VPGVHKKRPSGQIKNGQKENIGDSRNRTGNFDSASNSYCFAQNMPMFKTTADAKGNKMTNGLKQKTPVPTKSSVLNSSSRSLSHMHSQKLAADQLETRGGL
jgi:hypothetical protein